MSPNVTNVDSSFWNKTIQSNMLTVFSGSKVTCGIDFDNSANSFNLTVFDNVPSAFANDSGKGVNSNCKVSFKSMSRSFCTIFSQLHWLSASPLLFLQLLLH